jgi:NAD(P)-dependent dehydrogenase (short-subunit alcohol dehydrogenase family)
MTDTSPPARRVALIANTSFYIGPHTARLLAERGHDLVIGDPEEGLVEELNALGAAVEVVEGVADLADPLSSQRLVDAGLSRFGRIDAATAFSGVVITGPFADSTFEDLRAVTAGCLEAPYHFLKAITPPMITQGSGQVLLITSSSGLKPVPQAPLYSSVRAGANHLMRNVAAEVAAHGVQVNGLGTNFMDFDEFLRVTGGTDPAIRKLLEDAVPMKRLGTLEECAALTMAYLDGTCGFVTGQFVAHDGGWSN